MKRIVPSIDSRPKSRFSKPNSLPSEPPSRQQLDWRRTAARHEPEEAVAKDYGDQRAVIKFFYEQFGSPPESEWKGRYGTVSRMGDCAPKGDTPSPPPALQ